MLRLPCVSTYEADFRGEAVGTQRGSGEVAR